MIEKSFAWAEKRGLVRTNTVHGELEARLVLEDFFSQAVEDGESMKFKSQGTIEAWIFCFSPLDMVSLSTSRFKLLFMFWLLEDMDGSLLQSQFPAVENGEPVTEDQVQQAAAAAAAGKSKQLWFNWNAHM